MDTSHSSCMTRRPHSLIPFEAISSFYNKGDATIAGFLGNIQQKEGYECITFRCYPHSTKGVMHVKVKTAGYKDHIRMICLRQGIQNVIDNPCKVTVPVPFPQSNIGDKCGPPMIDCSKFPVPIIPVFSTSISSTTPV